ncbi:MAG: zeta toxin family protein [Azonexus sp.]|nr:zeta toxin family protein [Azonexus sp.]
MTTSPVPRLRMFAGPNGSGKSTLKDYLAPEWLGVYVNADEIEKTLRSGPGLNFRDFSIDVTNTEFQAFLAASTLLAKQNLLDEAAQLQVVNGVLTFGNILPNSYYASVLADLIRQKLLEEGESFTFETVMSHPSKVGFLQSARDKGFRTYLYFVATEDPDINIDRVRHRVAMGGHHVDTDKIISRYDNSLNLLFDAVLNTDRAYIFDNSGYERVWIAEVVDAQTIELKSDVMPNWFKNALWDKFSEDDQVA